MKMVKILIRSKADEICGQPHHVLQSPSAIHIICSEVINYYLATQSVKPTCKYNYNIKRATIEAFGWQWWGAGGAITAPRGAASRRARRLGRRAEPGLHPALLKAHLALLLTPGAALPEALIYRTIILKIIPSQPEAPACLGQRRLRLRPLLIIQLTSIYFYHRIQYQRCLPTTNSIVFMDFCNRFV